MSLKDRISCSTCKDKYIIFTIFCNLEEGVVDTVMRGRDTDTNAGICGSLLGAVYGRANIR
jgi:ADP-ribosylglycohydrolase